MAAFGPLLLEDESLRMLLRDMDGDLGAALLCWGVVLGAFIILRVPREVVLGCLIAAVATMGVAVVVIDTAPVRATAAAIKSSPQPHAAGHRAISHRASGREADRLP